MLYGPLILLAVDIWLDVLAVLLSNAGNLFAVDIWLDVLLNVGVLFSTWSLLAVNVWKSVWPAQGTA